jgi:DNA-binding LytR/AlgR family response regulator
MLKIGICEDDERMSQQLREVVLKVLFPLTEVEITMFADGEECVASVEQGQWSVQLLFMDIHMKNKNGLDTALYLRAQNIDVDIIFVTVSKEYVFEGYTYKAFAYWLKPLDVVRIRKDLYRYMEEKNNCSECLDISNNRKEERIPLNRIVYIESRKRKIVVHTLNEEYSFYGKMDEVERVVPENMFFRCHQSYIVNREMVDSIERTELFAQGNSIPISRKYHTEFEKNVVQETDAPMRITKSLVMNQTKAGAIVFVKGELVGSIIRIRGEKEITIGRSAHDADIVMNDENVSRRHCVVIYHTQTNDYSVVDYSKNGTFQIDGERLEQMKEVRMKPGTELRLGNSDNAFRLG